MPQIRHLSALAELCFCTGRTPSRGDHDHKPGVPTNSVEPFPARRTTALTDELGRILNTVRGVAPEDAVISFDFDGRLHIHVDVRRREEVTLLEAVLPTLGCGRFHSLSRGATPHHPFSHRVSAMVAA